MCRKIKAVGLALVAVLAVSAVAASGASAAAANFEVETAPAFVHGVQEGENTFTVNSKTVKCPTMTFSATQNVLSIATLTVHPDYGPANTCTAFGMAGTVTTTGCNYQFNQPAGTTPTFTGTINIACGSGSIVITTASCTVTIGSQGPLNGITYTDELMMAARQVKVTANVATISANVTGPILTCGTNGARVATYSGVVITRGYTSATRETQVGYFVM
jgi:hypothetical protein